MHSSPLPPCLIAGHLAVDFVNSVATPHGETIDWLRDGASAMGWFASVSLFPDAALRKLQRGVAQSALDEVAAEARELREWLRGTLPHPKRLHGSPQVGERLNEILARGCAFQAVAKDEKGLEVRDCERLENPGQLLVPIAKAIARLVTEEDLNRVRPCEGSGCSLWFLDQTKAGRRRFCSATVCGNRAKVAAFRSRQRES